MRKNQRSLLFSFLSYGMGVVMGVFVIFVATWADLESSAYDFPRLASAGLDGLHCPILMTRDESGTISLDVSNTTRDRFSPSIKTQLSTRLLPEQFLEEIQLMPGETKRLEWSVNAENIDRGYFVFAKVLLFSAYPLPPRETTCGILVLDLPGTGRVIVPVLVVLSLISMGWGLYLLNRFRHSTGWLGKPMGSMMFLAITVAFGLVLSFAGGWMLSLLVLVVTVLLIITLVGSLLVDQPR